MCSVELKCHQNEAGLEIREFSCNYGGSKRKLRVWGLDIAAERGGDVDVLGKTHVIDGGCRCVVFCASERNLSLVGRA